MEFLILRTSAEWDEKPHKRAFKKKFTRVDQRKFKSEDEFNSRVLENWRDHGQNHRVNEIGIARDFNDEDWFIKISSLAELLDLSEECGKLILTSKSYLNKDISEIEIHDDYR